MLPLRFITATSLFDGHDAAINVMRRIIQAEGAEVIHLGHNRSVEDIVNAAVEEDAHAIAVSSYQGGHMEFFTYMVELLAQRDAAHIQVFGGGGGVIVPAEVAELEARGIAKIYTPEDGQKMGLVGMIQHMVENADKRPPVDPEKELTRLKAFNPKKGEALPAQALARLQTFNESLEDGALNEEARQFFISQVSQAAATNPAPVLGITGTGGAGKSSLTDEVIRRFLDEFSDKTIAVLSVDPTHRRTGGALLGDRIRMNALGHERVFMHSIATRQAHRALPLGIERSVALCQAAGFDLVIVETAGIGQSDTEITDVADFTLYVMTSEFGAASQLEKIGMLDYADMIAINKFEKRGSQDALRDVQKQVRRNRGQFETDAGEFPVYGTIASRFRDPETDRFYKALIQALCEKKSLSWRQEETDAPDARPAPPLVILPPERERYLSEISQCVRDYKARTETQADAAGMVWRLRGALETLGVKLPEGPEVVSVESINDKTTVKLVEACNELLEKLTSEERKLLAGFEALKAGFTSEKYTYQVRDKVFAVDNYSETLCHIQVPKVVLPRYRDWGDQLRWLMLENAPGFYPFTAGVFPFKREEEDPTRMFAGEGTPERTNRRFHLIASGQKAQRLSTAFDSVTLYGEDPHIRPDIFGKVGNSGVSICTLDDMKRLYSGFDLVNPTTSVSMTINGPAPMILAFFLNTAIDQGVERHLKNEGKWDEAVKKMKDFFGPHGQPTYREERPSENNGLGLGLLGISGDKLVAPEVYAKIKEETLRSVRGTVQADILKEDQAQNTCIFSTDFALGLMGDIQAFFVDHQMTNFYSVSVSGYHMAEAGANPITQVAFTLANGFTFVEYYLNRGLSVDDFARNMSFFFSNGMEPEYAVIGRVARRIWAVAMKEKYRAGERAQKLKYHIQTSGRSLHAQEISFNDIRTTLQALYALYDNCNSLHTNAYDEAITTPTEESVRRAIAIQLIINRELGLSKTMNPLQGSFVIEELTQLVEEAILDEFDRLTARGGVLGAMETMYQRSKIQEESLFYEELKHSGDYPIVGVNTYLNPSGDAELAPDRLVRSTETEKTAQIESLAQFKAIHKAERGAALEALKTACHRGGNVFSTLMETVKFCSLGEISSALYEVGGQYRRSM